MNLMYHNIRNKKKLSTGPPDHTHQQHDDPIPSAPKVVSMTSVAEAGSESSEDEGVTNSSSGRRRKGKGKNKRKASKVSYTCVW